MYSLFFFFKQWMTLTAEPTRSFFHFLLVLYQPLMCF